MQLLYHIAVGAEGLFLTKSCLLAESEGLGNPWGALEGSPHHGISGKCDHDPLSVVNVKLEVGHYCNIRPCQKP